MGPDASGSIVREIMSEFADRTGLAATGPRRGAICGRMPLRSAIFPGCFGRPGMKDGWIWPRV